MLVTDELMNAMGSKIKDDDPECTAGFLYFKKHVPEPALLNVVIHRMRGLLRYDETLDKTEGQNRYMSFLFGLRTSAQAIRLGGAAVETGRYRFRDKEFSSLKDAQAAKELARLYADKNHVRGAGVSIKETVEGKLVLKGIIDVSEVKEGLELQWHDPVQNKPVKIEPAEALAKISEHRDRVLDAVTAEPIFSHIRDADEGWTAWEEIT